MSGDVPAVPAVLCGFCRRCGVDHAWDNDVDVARAAVAALFDDVSVGVDHDRLSRSRGKMIGALVAVDDAGVRHVLKAYSGDLDGAEDQPGWAPSLVRRADTAPLQTETWAAIARLDQALVDVDGDDAAVLRAERRAWSQRLMAAMFAATQLTSAGGVTAALPDVFVGNTQSAMPSGTADCVLPKLFVAAHRARLRPVAFAEAWWGPDHGTRRHGALQAPCTERCAPLLGFLLCPARR